MRLAVRLLVLVPMVSLIACRGEEGPTPPPLAQRFVSEADFPGLKGQG